MNSSEIHALLDEHIDGTLDEKRAAQLLACLREDPDAAAMADGHRRMHLLLATAFGRRSPLPLADRILALRAAAQQHQRRRLASTVLDRCRARRRRPAWRMMVAIAATLALVVGATWWFGWRNAARVQVIDCLGRVVVAGAVLAADDAVPAEEEIHLSDQARLRMRCDDGSTFELHGPGRFAHRWEDLRRLRISTGHLDAVIAPQDPARPVILETPQARITVLGTALSVTSDELATRVAVDHGRVRVHDLLTTVAERVLVDGETALAIDPAVAQTMAAALSERFPTAMAAWDGDGLPATWRRRTTYHGDDRGRLVPGLASSPLTLSLNADQVAYRIPLGDWERGYIRADWEVTGREAQQRGDFQGGQMSFDLTNDWWQTLAPDHQQPGTIRMVTDQTTTRILWQRVRRMPTGNWYAVRKRLAGIEVFSGFIFVGPDRLYFEVATSTEATVLLDPLRIDRIDPG